MSEYPVYGPDHIAFITGINSNTREELDMFATNKVDTTISWDITSEDQHENRYGVAVF